MGTRQRVVEEGADLVSGFGREYVLELASLLLDFGFAVHGERIGEEAFGQAVAADDIGGALVSTRGEFDDRRAVAGRKAGGLQRVVAGIDEGLVIVRFGRVRARRHQSHGGHFFHGDGYGQSAVDFHPANLRDLAVSARANNSSSTSSNCSSSAMAKTSWAAIFP